MAKDQVGSKRSQRRVVAVSGEVLVFFSKDIDLGTEAECRFNLSLSLNLKWLRTTNPTINDRVAHTSTTTNGGRRYHSPFLFCFLFYFSIYFNFICLFFSFSFLSGLVCWLGLVARSWWMCVNLDCFQNGCKFGWMCVSLKCLCFEFWIVNM